jgi:hypothetical protein
MPESAIAQTVSRRLPGFDPRSDVGFVVDKVAMGQDFLRVLRFPGAGTIGQLVADVPSGFSLTPPQETKKKKISCHEYIRGNGDKFHAFPALSLNENECIMYRSLYPQEKNFHYPFNRGVRWSRVVWA